MNWITHIKGRAPELAPLSYPDKVMRRDARRILTILSALNEEQGESKSTGTCINNGVS